MADGFVFADPKLTPEPKPDVKRFHWQLWGGVVGAFIVWWLLYQILQPLAHWLTYDLLGLPIDSRLGESVAFFLYDVPKILLLLTGMIFLVSVVRTFFSPEQTRALLGGKRQGLGNGLAALLGVATPFCSCSAVPLFIGFVESGIPLGVTFSFLIAAPMVNEVALVLLLGLFGWPIAVLYFISGLTIAIVAGVVIGLIPNIERGVEDFVWQISVGENNSSAQTLTWANRLQQAGQTTREILGKVWLYVVIGIAIGAAIHGYVPEDAMASILGKDAWWSVPAAVLIGVPMYSNAAGVIPVIHALMEKGAALGPTLAFMMSVVALSLPEMIILRRVLKLPLIIAFIGIVAVGIIFTGYLFNFVI
ncbi:MAG: permease [Anaerolineae bacterium]|nr:permease [Anaerolineae bacterium]MCB0180414.1 permease [Anaerolineae bacterium]MCB9105965.1 permease [Anaerolineales bacterium]